MKKQYIKFNDFMSGAWKEPRPVIPNGMQFKSSVPSVPVFSFLPISSGLVKTMFFHQGALFMLGVGAVAIGLTYFEKRLVKKGDEAGAELVHTAGTIMFPLFCGALLLILLTKVGRIFF